LYERAQSDMDRYLAKSSHRNRLQHLNLTDDIKYCLTLDLCQNVPVLRKGELVRGDM